jgi:hypothetical protein
MTGSHLKIDVGILLEPLTARVAGTEHDLARGGFETASSGDAKLRTGERLIP